MFKRSLEVGLILAVLLVIAGLTMAGGQVYMGINNRTADGVVGQPGFFSFYSGTSDTMFNNPYSCALDSNGNLWVADRTNYRVLKFTANDGLVSDTTADLVIGQASFSTAYGGTSDTMLNLVADVNFDANGNLYVIDTANRVLCFNADSDGVLRDTTADRVFGQAGFFTSYNGRSDTMLSFIYMTEFDGSGNMYVPSLLNNRVVRFNADSDGVVRDTTADLVIGQAGFLTNYSGASDTMLTQATGVDLDAQGNLYVACYNQNRVLRFDAASTGVVNDTTADYVFGQAGFYGTYSGTSDTMLGRTNGVTVDLLGNLWVLDAADNYRILKFDVSSNGVVTDTTADFVIGGGDPNGGFDSGIFGRSDTMIGSPYHARFSPSGYMYVADYSSHRILRYNPYYDYLGDDDNNCFLATAAYGDEAPELGAFHQFRDEVLMTSRIGRGLVSFYYTHGPSAASYVGGDASRFVTRAVLTPVLGLVKIINMFGLLGAGLLLLGGTGLFAFARKS